MTNQATVRSTGTSISTNTSTNTCIWTLENASIVRTLFDLFFSFWLWNFLEVIQATSAISLLGRSKIQILRSNVWNRVEIWIWTTTSERTRETMMVRHRYTECCMVKSCETDYWFPNLLPHEGATEQANMLRSKCAKLWPAALWNWRVCT